MRSQKSAVGQIKRVLFIACRVVWRRIERVEAMPFIFNVRSIRQRETHAPKNLNSTLVHLVKRMNRTDLMRRSWEGDVDLCERL